MSIKTLILYSINNKYTDKIRYYYQNITDL